MNILFATSEALPFVKTGGLGDVMGSLPSAVSQNNNVCVFLPFYASLKHSHGEGFEFLCSFNVVLGWRNCYAGLFHKSVNANGTLIDYYFVDNEYYFNRNCYGYNDDGERFAFFSKAVLEAISYIDFAPDIIHCNDWQTGYIPLFLKAHYSNSDKYCGIKTLFTIHNIEYQGKADYDFLDDVLGVSENFKSAVMHNGLCNSMKSAIVLADGVSTVSKTYAHEIKHVYFANGLEAVINQNAHKIYGIVNGIDNNIFNPETDPYIPVKYNENSLWLKEENKKHMQEHFGLNQQSDVPVFAIISRLVSHKGLELVEAVFNEMMSLDIQIIVIGNGDNRFEDFFKFAQYNYPGKVSANIMFDKTGASMIYAGSDFLLMPSKTEPCGLSQMIAMRYATIPIVRETGGLVDTVEPIDLSMLTGSGITFKTFNAHDMLNAVNRAKELYNAKDKLNYIKQNIMKIDNSWSVRKKEYLKLYEKLLD